MLTKLITSLLNKKFIFEVHAHCDGPCGVYDPASSRVAAEAVLAMTKKLIALTPPSSTDSGDWTAYSNTFSRYVAVKEEQAKETKKEIALFDDPMDQYDLTDQDKLEVIKDDTN